MEELGNTGMSLSNIPDPFAGAEWTRDPIDYMKFENMYAEYVL